jgi:regulator of sigma E protease
MNLVIFLIILLVLVIVHEFGHFFSAKRFGIRVDEFGFGFPPKLFGKKFGETEYTVNALPFGGFVKIFGENPDEESISGPDSARSFVNKPRWQQAIVLFAGVFANFLLAWILFSAGFMSGLPASVGSDVAKYELKDVSLVVLAVNPDSPAERAGLRSGDKITHIESGNISISEVDPDNVKATIAQSNGVPLKITYSRGSEDGVLTVTPAENPAGEYVIGIAMDQIGIAKLPVLAALWQGGRLSIDVLKGTVLGLYTLILDAFKGDGSWDNVTGPVGLVGMVGDIYDFGIVYLLSFTALISINLAVINLFPFPALDGGRLLFLLIEKIKGSRMNIKAVNIANMVGFAVLILLMLVVTYHDIVKLF